ncbi:Radical SAM domain protein [uncultured Desulfobacterium sp.]|uniref:Radical SAM domain protein n=1 Tax=uncultured Desulfobacterium sp. TaxID=201089 RepID=A0A445MQS7_9BACT|nr:Radical SAM domain protein [uncultured Desulfobacterium sp.]
MSKQVGHSQKNQLRLVAWEVTRSCNLNCIHCRAASGRGPYAGELDTNKSIEILNEISSIGSPIVILTGGEPLLRGDIFDLAKHGTAKGLRMVMATNGSLLTPEIIRKIKSSGIKRVSVSIDGADKGQHDQFRMVDGAFEKSLSGVRQLQEAGVEFQINTTVTRHNFHNISDILGLSVSLGAVAHHLFLLVPTGRAREMKDQEIGAAEYEQLLHWFYQMRDKVPLHLKATCAPHYYRILRQEASSKGEKVTIETYGLDAMTRGCLGGTSFCFISYDGIVQPCGYLELNCGDLKQSTFSTIWHGSEKFGQLREFSAYKGKCGRCEYIRVCGGCRARAFEATGDFLAEEPLCAYEPLSKRSDNE